MLRIWFLDGFEMDGLRNRPRLIISLLLGTLCSLVSMDLPKTVLGKPVLRRKKVLK